MLRPNKATLPGSRAELQAAPSLWSAGHTTGTSNDLLLLVCGLISVLVLIKGGGEMWGSYNVANVWVIAFNSG